MSISWWRSWHGAPMDHKWSVIGARADVKPGVVSAIAWALFDYASQADDRGSVKGFDTETYAVYSGLPLDDVEAVIRVMTDKGIIVNGRLANWEKRQPKREDDSNERVRKFREMKRDVTQGNAPEKEKDRDKDRDKETDKDADKDADADDNGGGFFASNPLSVAFEQEAKILAPGTDPKKWMDAIDQMTKLGITPSDVKQAIFELRKKNYVIVGPSSIVNAAINVHGKTNGKKNPREELEELLIAAKAKEANNGN